MQNQGKSVSTKRMQHFRHIWYLCCRATTQNVEPGASPAACTLHFVVITAHHETFVNFVVYMVLFPGHEALQAKMSGVSERKIWQIGAEGRMNRHETKLTTHRGNSADSVISSQIIFLFLPFFQSYNHPNWASLEFTPVKLSQTWMKWNLPLC